MAVKTITIDLQAYGLLLRRKRTGQSFSDVIKEHFGITPSAGAFKAYMRERLAAGRHMDDDFLDAVDEVIRDRVNHPVRVPEPFDPPES
jgi:predicted CopG family antitoxin